LAESDLTTQARLTAAQVAQNIQAGSKTAAEQFNKFVEDSASTHPITSSSARSRTAAAEPEHKDFWDSFGAPVGDESGGVGVGKGGKVGGNAGGRDSPITRGRASPAPKSSAVGTAAMRKGAKEKEEDKWDDF
ncbi:MAG: hypothetical protein Q9226_007005, partial [Calogaya cf. arnoldii]